MRGAWTPGPGQREGVQQQAAAGARSPCPLVIALPQGRAAPCNSAPYPSWHLPSAHLRTAVRQLALQPPDQVVALSLAEKRKPACTMSHTAQGTRAKYQTRVYRSPARSRLGTRWDAQPGARDMASSCCLPVRTDAVPLHPHLQLGQLLLELGHQRLRLGGREAGRCAAPRAQLVVQRAAVVQNLGGAAWVVVLDS